MSEDRPTADRPEHRQQDAHRRRRLAWGWWFFAAGALFYLLAEHRAHLFGVLPYLILLACPLMHFFMHGRHGGHGHGHDHVRENDK